MKKLCSILCIVAMMVSMLAVMAFPVTAAEPATQSVTSTVAGFENLFEFSSELMGVVDNTVGNAATFSSNANFYSSEAITVTEGETYTFGPVRTSQDYALVGIDGAGNTAVSIAAADATSTFALSDDINGNMVFCTYTVPAGVAQIRVKAEALYARSFLMVKGTYTLQQWKDWVAYTYPAQEFKNLGEGATSGRYGNGSTTPVSASVYCAPALITVEQNDVIYYGPANVDQGYQLTFYPSGATPGASVINGLADGTLSGDNEGLDATNGTLKVVETFDNGQVIYAWRAQAAGSVGLVAPSKYSDILLVTKNQPFSEQSYYNYWDNQPNANLWNSRVDLHNGYYEADGSITPKDNGTYNCSHSIAVRPGDVIELGPCYDNAASWLIVKHDINRSPVDGGLEYFDSANPTANPNFELLGTTTADGTTDSNGNAGLMLRYTVPEGVGYVYLMLRKGQYDAFTAHKIGSLTDSDNLYDAETAIMGQWKTDAATPETYNNTEYYATEKISVTAGETIFFGPARTGQGYQLLFEDTAGNASYVFSGNVEVYDTFPTNSLTTKNSTGDLVIYKYTASADGTIAFPVRAEYNDEFIITRGKPFSTRQFNFYWDNKAGANLYNIALDPTTGGIRKSGVFDVNPSTFYSTHMIDVVPGETLTFGPVDLGQGYQLCGWNMLGALTADSKTGTDVGVDLTGIYQGATIGDPITSDNTYGIMTYTVPVDVNKLSIVVRKEIDDRFMVVRDLDVEGMTATQIEDYYYNYVGIKKNSPLKGKTALFVGDSITQGAKDNGWAITNLYPVTSGSNGSWSGRIHRNYLMGSVVNNGVGGSSLSTARLNTYGRIITQLQTAAGQDFDYVVLHGGVNDAWSGYPLGTYDPNNFDPTTFNIDTYAGGLEETIYTAIELFGDKAAITYIMNFYAPNKASGTVSNMSAYFALAKEICAKWGITYLDLYNNAEITEKMMSTTKASPYFPDDIHPNEMGYAVLWSYIGDHVETTTPYSENSGNSWDKLADALIDSFNSLETKFFSADSRNAVSAAIEDADALEGYERYEAVKAAVGLLEQGGTPIPVSLYNSNYIYQRVFTKAGTFGVSTADDLLILKDLVNNNVLNSAAVIKQTADIDLAGDVYKNLRIGSADVPFAATYDGGDHKLLNYTVDDGTTYNAMFPMLSGTIKNLIVEKANVKIAAWSAVLVSRTTGTAATLENVHIRQATVNKVASPSGTNNSGSIMISGPKDGNSKATLRNCTVSGCRYTIGVATGNIGFFAAKDAGGSLTFENCHAFGNTLKYTAAASNNMGGIVGEVYGKNDSLTNCTAFNNTYIGTTGFTATGGLIGLGSEATLTNCGTNDNGTVAGSGTTQSNTTFYTTAAAVTENLYNGTTPINVAAGETVFFGPVDPDTVWPATFNGSVLARKDLIPVDTFLAGQVLYAYKATVDGTFLATVGEEYEEMCLVAKVAAGEVLSDQIYHNYWDNLPGANLYNVKLDLASGYIEDIGSPNSTATHNASHFIKVTPGDTITFGPAAPTQTFQGVTFDANYTKIKYINTDNYPSNLEQSGTLTTVDNPAVGDVLDNGMVFYTFTVPEGVAYINLVNCSTVRSMYVALKNATGLTAESYYDYLGVDETNPLNGKNALFVGDSISRGARDPKTYGVLGWAGRIGIANNMNWANYSVSGTSLSTVRPQGRILDQLVRANTGTDYDYVVIQGGVNDAWGADDAEIPAPVGTVSDSFDPASFDITTYAGGLEETLYTAIKLYGDTARIIYVLNYEASACEYGTVGDMADYFAMGEEICRKWGVEVCDLYSKFDFNDYTYTDDLIHATYEGYDLLYPEVEESMKNAPLYADGSVDGIAEVAEGLKDSAAALDTTYFTGASVDNFNNAVAAVTGNDAAAIVALQAAAEQLKVKDNTVVPMALLIDGNYFHESVAEQVKETTVATGYEFKVLADLVNAGTITNSVKVTQTANIDLKDYSDTRIGISTTIPFAGTYDGGNFIISNVTITGTADNTALFPYLSGTIKNLKIDQADVSANGWSAIVVSRVIGSTSLIDNVHVTNSTITKAGTKNGFAVIVCQGNAAGDKVTVKNCSVSGVTVNTNQTGSRFNFGWIVSRGQSGGLVMENCYAYGNTMNMLFSTYGLVAEAEAATITNCGSFNNTLLVEPTQPAAIVSHVLKGTLTIENCYSDLENLYYSNNQNGTSGGDATLNASNNYMGQTAEAIADGSLAYTLKTTSQENWVQDIVPMVTDDGEAVVKVTYVVDGATVQTTYTNSDGDVIAPIEDPEKADYLFKGWTEKIANNGDITYTAKFVYTVDAANVDALISAIGEVDANSGDKIDAARQAYDALSDEEKELVTNYADLIAAEEAYQEIPKQQMSLVLTAPKNAYKGNTANVQVSLESNPGVSVIAVSIGYDADYYTYLDITPSFTKDDGSVIWIKPEDESDFVINEDTGITWITVIFITSSIEGFTGTDLFTVNFDVTGAKDAPVETTILGRVNKKGAIDTAGTGYIGVAGDDVEIAVSKFLLGDFDNDLEVSLLDAVRLLRYIVETEDVVNLVNEGVYNKNAGDYNSDGFWDTRDVIDILHYVSDNLVYEPQG